MGVVLCFFAQIWNQNLLNVFEQAKVSRVESACKLRNIKLSCLAIACVDDILPASTK